MSERMTTIYVLDYPEHGVSEYGRKSVDDMVRSIMDHAAYMKHEAETILAMPRDAFRVETHTGVHVRDNIKILQRGRFVGIK